MSLATRMTRPCTITTRGVGDTEDELGNEIPSETTVATVCEIQQGSTDEPRAEGEVSTSVWTGWFPSGTAIDTASSVDAEGLGVFEVVGAPMPWANPNGGAHLDHVEARLRRTAGAHDAAGS